MGSNAFHVMLNAVKNLVHESSTHPNSVHPVETVSPSDPGQTDRI
jgi:hypothetical protein